MCDPFGSGVQGVVPQTSCRLIAGDGRIKAVTVRGYRVGQVLVGR